MIHLMIIYDVVNIFSVKNYTSSRKLRVGLNWSTTTIHFKVTEYLPIKLMGIQCQPARGLLFTLNPQSLLFKLNEICMVQY